MYMDVCIDTHIRIRMLEKKVTKAELVISSTKFLFHIFE